MQVIAKLTEVSNQAQLNCVELLQEKNALKQEVRYAVVRYFGST